MTRFAPTLALAAGLATLAAAGFAIAQGTAPQPQPAQPGMMGQMPGMQPHMQQMPQMQQRMMPGAQPPGPVAQSPSTAAFMAANEKMHRDMAITYSGNADRDFVAGMIPHHQGAIDMARVVLEHGSDPAVRAIANAVIRDQEREITEMRAILARIPAR